MKEYHFQKEQPDFGKTVRLDDINEKVKRIKKEDTEDDLGDANAFLDAFESENFDTPPVSQEEEEGDLGDTRELPPQPFLEEPEEEDEDGEDDEDDEDDEEGYFGFSKRTAALLAVAGVIACILGFSLVRCGFHPTAAPIQKEAAPLLVKEVLEDQEFLAYDIEAQEKKLFRMSEETKIIDEAGRAVAHGSLAVGDLFLAALDTDGETILTADLSGTELEIEEVTGLQAEPDRLRLAGETEQYDYAEETLFLYQEEEIEPTDLEPCDVLTLKSYAGTVWCAEVEEYHGYLLVEQIDHIQKGELQLDEEEPIPLEEGLRLPVKEGTHKVTISGSNIETREDNLLIEAGKELEYDFSKAQEKVGVIIVNANVSEYKLYINGAVSESPAVLPMGEYDLVILKNGYKEWNQHVSLQQNSVTVNAELQRDIQYGTLTVTADVEGVWVYINGEEYGVAPMEVNLPYGSYHVTVEKSGYEDYRQTIQIQGSAATLHATLE